MTTRKGREQQEERRGRHQWELAPRRWWEMEVALDASPSLWLRWASKHNPQSSDASQSCKPRLILLLFQEALDAALEADFQTLVSMGFSRRKAEQALQACDGDVQAACEWLFSN